MTKTVYDCLKFIGNVFLPAFAAFYVSLAELWGLPYAAPIGGTAAALAVFINACLKKESDKFHEENPKK